MKILTAMCVAAACLRAQAIECGNAEYAKLKPEPRSYEYIAPKIYDSCRALWQATGEAAAREIYGNPSALDIAEAVSKEMGDEIRRLRKLIHRAPDTDGENLGAVNSAKDPLAGVDTVIYACCPDIAALQAQAPRGTLYVNSCGANAPRLNTKGRNIREIDANC